MDCPWGRAVMRLPDELLVDILSRVPAESLRELKLVCRAWRDLITDPFNRKRLPQTLEGFFHGVSDGYINDTYGRFTVLSGAPGPEVDPSFSFLTELPWMERMVLIDSCNGLLLFECATNPDSFGYIVCNPATKEFVYVPSPSGSPPPGLLEEERMSGNHGEYALAFTFLMFDPAVSSHFSLVQWWQHCMGCEAADAEGMHFYSSETRGWSDRSSKWKQTMTHPQCGRALVDGMLHFVVWQERQALIVAVDGEGKTCWTIRWPEKHNLIGCNLLIGQSQGRLYCITVAEDEKCRDLDFRETKLSVWVLEDYDTRKWILKLDVSCREVFGRSCKIFSLDIVAIHPARNVIFFVLHKSLVSYDMDSGKLRVLRILGNGHWCFITPYVPYFMESAAVASKFSCGGSYHTRMGDFFKTCEKETANANQGVQKKREQEVVVEKIDGRQIPLIKGKKNGNSKRGKTFHPDEDKVICSAWLNTGKDPIKGTSQTVSSFYGRMHQFYLENYDRMSTRSANSIQLRWSAIQKAVSCFSRIFSTIVRRNESGKNEQDRINDAIKIYQEIKPWKFAHCWEILRNEAKWNGSLLETISTPKAKTEQPTTLSETPTQSMQSDSKIPKRPEGRDDVKKRRGKHCADTSPPSAAVKIIKKMLARGQDINEQDVKHKAELMSLKRAKFELQKQQWKAKYDLMQEQMKLQRETTQEQIRLQKDMMETTTQIMFANLDTLLPPIREWVEKKQIEILARDGVAPNGSIGGASGSA